LQRADQYWRQRRRQQQEQNSLSSAGGKVTATILQAGIG
jgi:hypothetical protein